MRRVPLLLFFCLTLAVPSRRTKAQQSDDFMTQVWGTLNTTFALGEPGKPYLLSLLSQSVVLPSSLKIPEKTPDYLSFVDWVPRFSPILIPMLQTDGNPARLSDRLRAQIAFLTIKPLVLSAASKRKLDDAKKQLFQDGDSTKPTQEYADYLAYASKIEALRARLKESKSPEDRAQLRYDIIQLERDWPNADVKFKLENAQLTIRALSGDSDAKLQAWQDAISTAASPAFDSLLLAFSNPSDWRIVTSLGVTPAIPLAQDARVLISQSSVLSTRKSGTTNQGKLKGIGGFQMQVKRVEIENPLISDEILTNRNWLFSNNKLLSDGVPSATDSDNEVAPRFVQQLLVTKLIEIVAQDADTLETIARLLTDQTVTDVAIGNILLKSNGKNYTFYYPNTLLIAQPQIIGVLMRELPLSPNPEP